MDGTEGFGEAHSEVTVEVSRKAGDVANLKMRNAICLCVCVCAAWMFRQ